MVKISPITTQSSGRSTPRATRNSPTQEQWLEFGKDLCQGFGSVAESAVAAVIGAAVVVPATVVAGIRDLPRATSQIWNDALSQPTDNVPDYLIQRAAAATMMVPLALTPLSYGLVGLAVGSLGCAVEAQKSGLSSAIETAWKVAESAHQTISQFDYRP